MTLGAYPGGGGAVMLPRIIGEAKAKDFFFTARRINATEALNIGLIHRVVSVENLMDATLDFVSGIEQTSPLGLAALKQSINTGVDLPFDQAILVDQDTRRPLEATNDYQEGILAHFEKRKPQFKGS
jgi:enoyl-CoA hydratase/carnithine racemase